MYLKRPSFDWIGHHCLFLRSDGRCFAKSHGDARYCVVMLLQLIKQMIGFLTNGRFEYSTAALSSLGLIRLIHLLSILTDIEKVLSKEFSS